MATDHILYLTSTGNLDIFPSNHPSNFINRLSTPIVLETNVEYEMGLVSILYPEEYYGILNRKEDYSMTVFTDQGKTTGETVLSVPVTQNVLAGNLPKIIRILNNTLDLYLKPFYGGNYTALFSKYKIIRWNELEDKVEIKHLRREIDKKLVDNIEEIRLKMNKGLATILGFKSDVAYQIFNNKKGNLTHHQSSFNPSPRCGVEYIYLYTDVIQPSNFGGQLVNILDCFSLQNGGNRGIHNSIYKPLNTHFIDQISVKVRDQHARPIHFVEGSTLTCVVHIRPK